jgi:hypothetical protein
VVGEVRRCLHHAPRVARGAHPPAFAGEGNQKVMPALVAAGARKAVGKDAAFQVFGKRLAQLRLGAAVVAWPSNCSTLANSSQVSKCSATVW